MSGGGPPHQPHNRHVPPANMGWNHLQVPSYFPRQPQVAHMPTDPSLLHQPTWHTPTTEAMKLMPRAHTLNEMLKNEALFTRDCVDLSLTRNGNQNGELPTTPISLSVRDTNKINSLSTIDMPANKCMSHNLKSAGSPAAIRSTSISPGLKSASPALKSSSPSVKSLSPGRKSVSPGPKSASPGLNITPGVLPIVPAVVSTTEISKNQKRSNVRVDSILERLNPTTEKIKPYQESKYEQPSTTTSATEKFQIERQPPPQPHGPSVIVQATTSYDENSNSSGTNLPTATNPKEDDSGSMHSNEDSLDSTKSRRKRKPSKTIRVNKEEEIKTEIPDKTVLEVPPVEQHNHQEPQIQAQVIVPSSDPAAIATILEDNKIPERRRSSDDLDVILSVKTRRKASSESETIDNIAAMVQEGLKEKEKKIEAVVESKPEENALRVKQQNVSAKPVTVSVIKSSEPVEDPLSSTSEVKTESASEVEPSTDSTPLLEPVEKKQANTHFVDVENKLEEMFAGIVENHTDPVVPTTSLEPTKSDIPLDLNEDSLLKLDDSVTSTSQEVTPDQESIPIEEEKVPEVDVDKEEKKTPVKKSQKTRAASGGDVEDEAPLAKRKRFTKTKGSSSSGKKLPRTPAVSAPAVSKKLLSTPNKTPVKSTNTEVKDIYAYDSGSNTSSSRSRGPFVLIKGHRDSPLSVSVVNTPLTGDEDGERKPPKNKKYHDDSEYRHKVRSKGLHCSTLSNKYDAERKDASWICAFCKRGPHASEFTGPSIVSEVPAPGDLFGPYFITTQCPEFERRLDDPYDRQFKSRKISKALDESAASTSKNKKAKRKSESTADQGDPCLGISQTTENTYEVWAHEDCLVWSSGVYLIGPKIAGLEEAVWTCSNLSCSVCGYRGANISCLRRGCLNSTHLCCARSSHWQLQEENFKAYCPTHAR